MATAEVPGLFAPPPAVTAHPAVLDARRLATELLEPHAPAADDPARGVRREHLDALAAAGLASVHVPATEGGLGAPRAVNLEVVELIAGGCGATWFLLTQHELPQNLARAPLAELDAAAAHPGPAADRHRDVLSRASALAGVAVACGSSSSVASRRASRTAGCAATAGGGANSPGTSAVATARRYPAAVSRAAPRRARSPRRGGRSRGRSAAAGSGSGTEYVSAPTL